MNEELRQVEVVRFCEALTKRIRDAVKILGPVATGYGKKAIHDPEHNVIRAEAYKLGTNDSDQWDYTFTLDDGTVVKYDVIRDTPLKAYIEDQFMVHVFGDIVKTSADIHFSKTEICNKPKGPATTVDPYIYSGIRSPMTIMDFEKCLTARAKFFCGLVKDKLGTAAGDVLDHIERGYRVREIHAFSSAPESWTITFHFNESALSPTMHFKIEFGLDRDDLNEFKSQCTGYTGDLGSFQVNYRDLWMNNRLHPRAER